MPHFRPAAKYRTVPQETSPLRLVTPAAAPVPGGSTPVATADRPGGGGTPASEKRAHLRFDKAFPVRVESILFGEMHCVARNVSAGGIFLESVDPLPLGAHLRVCFLTPDESGEVVALGVVRNHYFINFADRGDRRSVSGMAVRFTGFEEDGERHLRACLDRFRVLH
jgi:hypothetical protein